MLNIIVNSISDAVLSVGRMTISNDALVFCLVFSAIGAAILAKFTGKIGEITIPLTFSVLFIGSFAANWALASVNIPIIVHQQELLVYTMVGMTLSSFLLLWFTGPEQAEH